MADPLEEAINEMMELDNVMEEISKAIKKSEDLDQLATNLGIALDRSLESRTPLAETKEEAQKEAETGELSKSEKISAAIEKKVDEATR